MSVASAVRAGSPGAAPIIETLPLRRPDASSPPMMTRRGWWLVAMNVLVPGSAQTLAGNRRLGRIGLASTLVLWTLALVAIVTFLLWREVAFAIATNWFALTAAQILLIGYALLWVVLTVDTLRLVRIVKVKPYARLAIPVLSVLLLFVSAGGAAYASQVAATARGTLGAIFGASGPAVPPTDGYYNILLLGADSGEGRDSMRFDSISVVSVNAETGATTITGIPRDMANVPFSEGPMNDRYPDGFTGYADPTCGWDGHMNHVRQAAEVCQPDGGESLYPDATANGSSPGVEATKDAAEGILGIEIPYYVFIDMHGFADLIDALGGVDIVVDERLPEGGGPEYDGQPAEEWATGWIEVGPQHMDGETAQWYARSRYTTSDWDRMERQRELQEAMLAQFTPANVLANFNDIAAAGEDIVETDIPQSLLPTLMELALDAKEQRVTTIELTPESAGGIGVDPEDPDFAYIQGYVDQTLHPVEPTDQPQG